MLLHSGRVDLNQYHQAFPGGLPSAGRLTWINVLARVRTDNEFTPILQGADAMQMRMASGAVMHLRKHMRLIVQIGVSLIAAAIMAAAALDAVAAQEPIKREIIPGSELMTSQERERYRQRIRGAKTSAEEEQIRAEHLQQVRERARLRGLRLPESAEVSQTGK